MIALSLGAFCGLTLSAQEMTEKPVYNETTSTEYDDLASAIAAAVDNDVIVLKSDVTLSGSRIDLPGKTFTIKSADAENQAKIIRADNNVDKLFFLIKDAATNVTIQDVIIDGNNVAATNSDVEANYGGTLILSNVVFQNCTHDNGRVINFKGNANVYLTNVKMNNCSVSTNDGYIYVRNNGNDKLYLSGDNLVSVNIPNDWRIFVDQPLTNTVPIDLYVPENRATLSRKAVVLNTKDYAKFRFVNNPAICLWPKNGTGNELNVYESSVCNETTQTGWYAFNDAVNYAADNDVIALLKDVETEGGVTVSGKSVVVKGGVTEARGAVDGHSITLTKSNRFFLVNGGGSLSLENLVCDGNNMERNGSFFEAAGDGNQGGTLNMTDVELTNFKSTHNQGVVAVKNNAKANLENVSVTNSTVPENRGEIFVGNNNVSLSGDNSLSLYVEGERHINVSGLTNENPLTVILQNSSEERSSVINGTTETSLFNVLSADGNNVDIKSDGENNIIVGTPVPTAIDEIGVDGEDAPVEYYNVQGIRVENPEHGLYIKRQGNKVSKVIL